MVCQIQFFAAPSGCKPRLRDQEQPRLTAVCRLIERTLPAFTGCIPRCGSRSRKISSFQPFAASIAQRYRFGVVSAAMADENARHVNRPKVKRRLTEA
jgi:hypothetical protein